MTTDAPILITGAAGFIGSHTAQALLSQGQQVVGIDNFNTFYDPMLKQRNARAVFEKADGRFQLAQADICDRDQMFELFESYQPKAVIHLAAMAGVRPSIADPQLYTQVNLAGTVNLFDAAVKVGVKQFLFASSSSVYGNNPKTPFAEDDFVDHPISPYAATKKSGELLAHCYSHLYQMPMTCLRFFTVFGPRQRPDLAIHQFLRLVSSDQPIAMFGDGSTSRDYTYVDDIVAGILKALDHCTREVGYRVYNLGGEHPVTLKKMIETIEKVVGKKAVIDQQPMQPGDVQCTWADLTRSKAELGYQPKTSLEAGIAKQWDWMQSQTQASE